MKPKHYHFGGWATRNNIKCADGVTIRENAFADDDGITVPLVYQHSHNNIENVIGHAFLENRKEGVYAYCTCNESDQGKHAKMLVSNGDLRYLSIFANKLTRKGGDVLHGKIREVSLVLAGANPGAFIDAPIVHGEELETEATIYPGLYELESGEIEICHSDDDLEESSEEDFEFRLGDRINHSDDKQEDTIEHADDTKKEDEKMAEDKKPEETKGEKTVKDVFDEFTEEQKNVVYYMIGAALEEAGVSPKNNSKGDEEDVAKHNVFENESYEEGGVIAHSELCEAIQNVKRNNYGSMRDALDDLAIQHGFDGIDDAILQHGIQNVGYLFPEDKNLNTPPEFIKRPDEWVPKVLGATKHTPFSRIKSMFADITADEARAKGYTKGNRKTEEVFTLLKRRTGPTTIYKKQKMDRDDVIDITDFDVIAWLKVEMRGMLDEEIARAILIGDGRSTASDDKISEEHIRPVWTDDDLFTIKARYAVQSGWTPDDKAKAFIRTAIKARKNYRGSGTPTLYMDEDMLTDILLLEDLNGRTIYDDVNKLATKLRVKEIITVPVMENKTREVSGTTYTLNGLIVNLTDYNIGADKGGAVSMFDDFDIDYNAQKYLIETRCSGALVKPFSAIAVESYVAAGNGGN